MADRQRREMRVRNVICSQAGNPQHFVQQCRMTLGRQRDLGRAAVEPIPRLTPCIGERHRPLQDTGVGHHSKKRRDAFPRKTDPSRLRQLPVEPLARGLVLWNLNNMRIDQ